MLAAHRAGIKRCLLPTENARDIKDIPATILKSIRLELVDHMDDVLAEGAGAGRSGQFPPPADRRRSRGRQHPFPQAATATPEIITH